MNKLLIATVLVLGLTGTAFASHTADHKAAASVPQTTTYKLGNGVVVTVPHGTKVDIDKDSNSIDLQLDSPSNKPWWKIW